MKGSLGSEDRSALEEAIIILLGFLIFTQSESRWSTRSRGRIRGIVRALLERLVLLLGIHKRIRSTKGILGTWLKGEILSRSSHHRTRRLSLKLVLHLWLRVKGII